MAKIGVEVVARHVAVGVHDEGVGAWEAFFEEGEQFLAHGADIFRSHAERGAEHGVFCLFEREALDLGDGLDRPFELYAADEGVEGVGGCHDDAALLEGLDDTPCLAWIGVFCIYFYYHLKLQKYEVFLNCYTFFVGMSFYSEYEEMYRIGTDALRALVLWFAKSSECEV